MIRPSSNLVCLAGGVTRAPYNALNTPNRVTLTARNRVPNASTLLLPWTQFLIVWPQSAELSVNTTWTLLTQIAILVFTIHGFLHRHSRPHTSQPPRRHPKTSDNQNAVQNLNYVVSNDSDASPSTSPTYAISDDARPRGAAEGGAAAPTRA